MQRVVVVGDGGAFGVELGEDVGVVVVGPGDLAGLGVGGGEQARERVVGEGAGAPVGGVGVAALLVDALQVAEGVVLVVGIPAEGAGGVGLLPDVDQLAECICGAHALLASLVGDGGGEAERAGGLRAVAVGDVAGCGTVGRSFLRLAA